MPGCLLCVCHVSSHFTVILGVVVTKWNRRWAQNGLTNPSLCICSCQTREGAGNCLPQAWLFVFFSPNWAPQVVLRMWTGLAARLLHWWQLCSIVSRRLVMSWAPVLWSGECPYWGFTDWLLAAFGKPQSIHISFQGTWGHVLIDVLFSQECHSWQVRESLVTACTLSCIWSNSGILMNLFCFFLN